MKYPESSVERLKAESDALSIAFNQIIIFHIISLGIRIASLDFLMGAFTRALSMSLLVELYSRELDFSFE